MDSDGDGLSDQAEASRVRTVPFGAAAPVASAVGGPESVIAADLDGDGDADALAAAAYLDQIAWYENRLDEPSADSSPGQVITPIAEGGDRYRLSM